MIQSSSDFIDVRGLRYHVRRWGDASLPKVFMTHGWLDVSETFSYLVQPLLERFQVLMPDWRGFGLSEWPQDGYWFPDYVGDLEAVLDHYQPEQPVLLAGHSMGAQAASLYTGVRPQRVAKFACLDGLFLPDVPSELAPKRYARWLDELKDLPQEKSYPSYEDLAQRVRKQHPQLSDERALFVAKCWARPDRDGVIRLLADPKHRLRGPGLYRAAESEAIWKQVTARVLFVDAGKSLFGQAIPEELKQRRRACFRDHTEIVIAQAGHMLHFDAPEETGRTLLAFFGT